MNSASWALLLLVATGVVGLLGIWQLLAGGSRRAELAARGRVGADDGGGRSLTRGLDARLRRTATGRRFASWVGGAGLKLLPAELLAIVILAAVAGFFLLSNLLAPAVALIVAIGGSIGVTRAIIERRRGNRRDLFVTQLPEIARMLANGTSAGLSMPQAVRMASRELADPAGAELRRVVEEMQVGRPVEDALDALRERLPSREVAVLMSTIVIQQRAGGDTVRALGELAQTLESRKELRREIVTLLSGVVYTSYVVAGMGAGTILLINTISPGVTQEMTSSPLGIAGIVVAGVLWTIAFVLIRRTTRVAI